MLHLELLTGGEGSPEARQINGTRCVVGRSADADISLSGWKVHKEHAEVFVSNEQVFVRDLGSMFGTYVRDSKISTFGPLEPSDQIRIGSHLLT
ncbi:MAG: FHA domain-containing protein, partial [Alcaligenaceae bacterium]